MSILLSEPADEPKPPASATVLPMLPGALARMRQELVRAVRRVCPHWLAQDAEDLAQDALVRVWQAQQRGAVQPSTGYLYRAAYSAVVDEIRRRRRRVDGDERGEQILVEVAAPGDMRRDIAIGEGITRCLARQNEDRTKRQKFVITEKRKNDVCQSFQNACNCYCPENCADLLTFLRSAIFSIFTKQNDRAITENKIDINDKSIGKRREINDEFAVVQTDFAP